MAFGETLPPVEPPAASSSALDSNPSRKCCWMSVVSLFLGVTSFLFGPYLAIPALVFGHISRYRISDAGGKLSGNGLAFTGLITGYLSFVFAFMTDGLSHNFRVMGKVRQAQAQTEVRNIAAAVQFFATEYGKFPSPYEDHSLSPSASEFGSAAKHNSALFYALRALPTGTNTEHRLNPRQIVFFDGKIVSDPLHPRGGFADQDQVPPELRGCYFDPWGREYMIRINSGETPTWTAPDGTPLKQKVIAWSLGPDGKSGTKDDIVSWK